MKLFLIRHGMTKGNQEHRYVGATDESILPSEKERLRTSVERYFGNYQKDNKDSKIYISPMRRCMETAECLFPDMISQGRYEIIDNFREMDFGAFEYRNYQEINEDPDPEHREAYQRYIDSNGETAFPGGESKEEFIERVVRGFNSIVSDYPLPSKRKSFIHIESIDSIDELKGEKTISSKKTGNPENSTNRVFSEQKKVNTDSNAETLIFMVHGGTIMALLDRFSEPHRDYFEWSLKPGQGYETDITVDQHGDLKIINIKKIG
ncbi:histidine phosphatase family protein [Oribacterium sp. WCC10]|uniref:histidine phosphatase family protein n=1 Tax=Oribacterium sp. WCC10 TaxID=1855343 RepID=UPI0008F1BF4C|nr:histidine phosphatase family protein [Oribacterium sp. WCC10]SFG74365.1 alpha-ribazole phosphatase [Oribacterium sp. WCC10]